VDAADRDQLRTWAAQLVTREDPERRAAGRAIVMLLEELESRSATERRAPERQEPAPSAGDLDPRSRWARDPAGVSFDDEGAAGGLRRWIRRALGDTDEWDDRDLERG
jgi:hypothetical protein